MKLAIILSKLQKARSKGVKEIEVLTDWETKGNARVIKHRLNKMLGGKNAVIVKRGKWYLAEYFWSMTRTEFNDHMWRETVREMSLKNNIVVAVITILFILVTLLLTIEMEVVWL